MPTVAPRRPVARPSRGASCSGGCRPWRPPAAAAWVVPEILTAKPAAGATLSGPATSGQTSGTESVVTTSATTSPHTLAFTGFNLERDVGIGSALVAGGWAMHLWASRAAGTVADGAVGTAGSVADPAGSPPAEGG